MLAKSEPGCVGYRSSMGEVEHLLNSKRNAKDFVTSLVTNKVARIVAAGRIHEELRFFWPAAD